MKTIRLNLFLRAVIYVFAVLIFFVTVLFATRHRAGILDIRSAVSFYMVSLSAVVLVSSVRLVQKRDSVHLFMLFAVFDLLAYCMLGFVPETVDNAVALFYASHFFFLHSSFLFFVISVLQSSRFLKTNGILYLSSLFMTLIALTFLHPSRYSLFLSYGLVFMIYAVAFVSFIDNMERLFYMVSSMMRKINMISSLFFFASITMAVSGFASAVKLAALASMAVSYGAYYFTRLRI